MPKRIATPPPGDDEPKYLTVVQPYPLNANWELPEDYITFGRWIAGCIGTQPFYAVFYKPSARGMVILEIERTYPHLDRLLGEHRWSEFLKKPTSEEAIRVSQIFHCLYKTGREAQKDGWKRINVRDAWFKNWSPNNPIIQNPYPTTHWCPVPPEDKTNKPLCRPLPVKDKAPPPRIAPPVVGSANWVGAKTGQPQNTPQVLRGAWARGNPTPPALNISAKARKPANNSPGARSAVSPSNAWNKPIIGSKTATTPWSASTSASVPFGSPSSATSNSPTTASSLKTPSSPPGLGPPRGAPNIASSYPAPPGLVRDTGTDSSGGGPGSVPGWDDGPCANPIAAAQYEHLHNDIVGISLSPSQEKTLYNLASDGSPDPAVEYVSPWEQVAVVEEVKWDAGADEDVQNFWGEEEEEKVGPDPELLCKAHGIICKKGICRDYAKQLKELEKKKKGEAGDFSGNGKGRRGKGRNGNGGGGRWGDNKNDTGNNGNNVDGDGFALVGRSKGRRGGAAAKKSDSRAGGGDGDSTRSGSVAGSNTGRMRGNSISSNGGSVAAESHTGWTDVSVSPWDRA